MGRMNDTVIEVKDFRKVYGDMVAVDSISFEVQRGEIFGLLGPNGAGKTSTLESLEGLRSTDGGSLQVMGVDPTRESRKLRNLIGVQLQTSGLPESMRVDEAMRFFAAYHGVAPSYHCPNVNSSPKSHFMAICYFCFSSVVKLEGN